MSERLAPPENSIGLGSTVELYFLDDPNDIQTIVIERAHETGEENIISSDSPLGKAILGKSVGDTISYTTKTGGVVEVKIIHVT